MTNRITITDKPTWHQIRNWLDASNIDHDIVLESYNPSLDNYAFTFELNTKQELKFKQLFGAQHAPLTFSGE